MEKERVIQCVPAELLERLKLLGAKLWEERNPASVALNSLLDEFSADVKTLSHVIKEYEASAEQKVGHYKKEIGGLRAALAGAEAAGQAAAKKIEELRAEIHAREALVSEMKMKTIEAEGALNARYAARMGELYDRVNKKELEIVARWEEKSNALSARAQELELERAAHEKQLKLREKALEEDINSRKTELIKTFEKIRTDINAREQALESDYSAKQRQLQLREKALEEDFSASKADLKRTFDKVQADLEARELALAAREKGAKL